MPLPIAMARIAETEAAMGVTFPAGFKAKMSRSNGGEVKIDDETWFLFPFRDATDRKTLSRTGEDIQRETKHALAAKIGFPDDGVAIANNGAGDLLFLRRDGAALQNEVWIFRLRGAEVSLAVDDVWQLWQRG